jgi:glycerol-3-phosphate acyltransferase PlsX
MEGTARVVGEYMKRAFNSGPLSMIGGLLARQALQAMRQRMDWREAGGAPLVGVNGVALITHGRSDALAIENAVRRARETARTHFTDDLAEAVAVAEYLLEAAAEPSPPAGSAAAQDS